MTVYLDTSAALELLIDEAESVAVERYLRGLDGERVASSRLLSTELHRAVRRRSGTVAREYVEAVLRPVVLVDLERRDLDAATRLARPLRTNDAIHLAVAIRVGADAMLTYDAELADAARTVGIEVLAPA